MGDTKIEYCTKVWSIITGCTPVSAGCDQCWASRQIRSGRTPAVHGSTDFSKITFHPSRLDEPLLWRKPQRVFVCSMGDLFHEDVPNAALSAISVMIRECSWHTFLILTKRPERMKHYISSINPIRNLWLGVSVESPDYLWRVDHLRQTPAALRFISFEPLIADVGKVDLTGISWAIVGAESGPRRRPCNIEWVRSLKDQCVAARVPIFIKQASINGKLVKMPSIDGRVWGEIPEGKEPKK